MYWLWRQNAGQLEILHELRHKESRLSATIISGTDRSAKSGRDPASRAITYTDATGIANASIDTSVASTGTDGDTYADTSVGSTANDSGTYTATATDDDTCTATATDDDTCTDTSAANIDTDGGTYTAAYCTICTSVCVNDADSTII